MGAFLRILLTVVLFFYVFSMIIKLIFRRKMKKLQQQMEKHSDQTDAKAPESKTPRIDPNIGEYTEFEEVE